MRKGRQEQKRKGVRQRKPESQGHACQRLQTETLGNRVMSQIMSDCHSLSLLLMIICISLMDITVNSTCFGSTLRT